MAHGRAFGFGRQGILVAADILTQRRKDAEVDTNLMDQHEFFKSVRVGIVVETAIPKMESSVRSDIV